MEGNAPRYTFALKRGAILAGRYRIDRLLADSSSFALTYLATDTSSTGVSPMRVAVKEFLPRVLVGRARDDASIQPHSPADAREFARALQRFLREGEVLGGINSPCLTRIQRCVQENGTGYLVMEPRPGRPLPSALADVAGGAIDAKEAVALVARLLEVLERIHAQGIFHRAISANAIAVSDSWQPVLHGFSARRHVCGEPPELIPGFAAFEQYAAGDLGPWTDVYACAALLYQLVSGTAPPSAIHRAVGKPLAPASWLTQGVSSALSAAIVRGLSLMPEQRPIGAADFRNEIEQAATAPVDAPVHTSAFKAEQADIAPPPTIDADFGPEVPLPVAAQVAVEPQRPSQPTPETARFGQLVTRIADRVRDGLRDGLRPAAAMIRASKRASIDVRIGEDEPAEGLPRLASTLVTTMRKPENQRAARYIGAAALTLAVSGSAYGILKGGQDTSGIALQARLATTEVHQEAPVRPPIGAVQQGNATLPEASTAKPAPQNSESRPAESTKERSASATASLPTIKKLNVSAPIDAGQELVPVEVVLDLRTQLSNGRQEADAGQYALARRILASAMTSAGTAVTKYSGSKTLRSIRAELDSADRRVLGACQAENEMLKKRGGTAVPCN